MTVWANREGDTDHIKVSMTYGPLSASCVEDYGHLKSLWSSLGMLIEEIESEKVSN